MAKKRASLKDKNVFKKSKTRLDALLDSSPRTKTTPKKKQASKAAPQKTPSADELSLKSPQVEPSLPEDDLTALADEAILAAEMPDIALDTYDDEDIGDALWHLDDSFDLSAELEAALPHTPPPEAMPAGEMGDAAPNVDDSLGFAPALESPPGGPLVEDMPSAEMGDAVPDVDDSLGFTPALEFPPGDPPVEAMPSAEMGNAIPDEDDSLGFSPALEAPPDGPLIEAMPSAEMGDAVADVDDSLGFAPALESPPGGQPVEAMPSAEMGNAIPDTDDSLGFPPAIDAAADNATAPSQEDALDFSAALESPPEESYAAYLAAEAETAASSDAAPDTAASQPTNQPPEASSPFADEFDFSHSALADEPAPLNPSAENATIADAPGQAASSMAETSVAAAIPSAGATFGGPVVSRITRLSIAGDDMSDDILDLNEQDASYKAAALEIPDYILEDLSPEERKKRTQQLKDPRIKEQFMQTYNAVDAEYEHILSSDVSVNEKITNELQNLLGETRYIMTNYQIQFLAKAEWNIEQVRARLDRAEISAKKAIKWGPFIIAWGILWFFISVFFIFKPDFLLKFLTSNELMTDLLAVDIFLRALFFGAIGGVTAIFYYFLRSVANREFDPQYVTSYFTKPFMGMTLATMIYLLVFVFLRLFNIIPGSLEAPAEGGGNSVIFFMTLTWVLSLASGFQEHVAFNLLRKVIKKIMGDSNSPDDAAASPPPPGPYSPQSNS